MTFKDVVRKNFTGGFHKYLSYFLSGTFCVAMFFVYSTLILLDQVTKEGKYPMKALFIVTCVIILLFSMFFISYSHQAFVKGKKRELGVYMVVGMDEQTTRKMLILEALIIAGTSVLAGMLAGTVFSRFFQLVVIRLTDVKDLGYQLSPLNYFITIAVFVLIFGVCFWNSDRELKKEDITSIMKSEKKKEGRAFRKRDALFAVLGFAAMCFSAVFIWKAAPDNHMNSKLWVILVFLAAGYGGLFLLIAYGGKTVLYFLKGRKKYYRMMLTVSDISHKYNQNIKVMLILAMLASMIVLLVGSPVSLVSISEDIAEDGCEDVEFVSFGDTDETKMDDVLKNNKIKSWTKKQITVVTEQSGEIKPVLSVDEYNTWMGTKLSVRPGEVYNLITTWEPGNNGIPAGTNYVVACGEKGHEYQVCESIKGQWNYNNLFPTKSILLLSKEDYEAIRSELICCTANEISFEEGWKNTQPLIDNMRELLGENALLASRIELYKELKGGYSTFLFITCSMCFMFFVSTGSVLYFKQYNEIEDEKKQYKRLYNLGISDKTVKKNISLKMAVIYFVPLIGSVMGMLVMYYLANLFGGNTITDVFMRKSVIGVVCYAASQALFYLFLRVRYVRDVLRVKEL